MVTRLDKKTRRKKRRRRILLLLFFVIIIAAVIYVAFQYYSGIKQAGNDGIKKEKIVFHGEKDANGKVNFLLLGIDQRKNEKSRTDSMMVAQYDPKNKKVKLISLMRDMFVEIPGYKNYKLNTAYFLGGPELLRKTIKQNFGLDVQYYVMVNFKGFEKIVDTLAPDGIEINVKKEMSKNIGVTLHPGLQKLHGKELLGYARFRHDAQGDFGRVERQQEVLQAIKDEVLSVNGFTKAPKLLGTIQPYIQTNMDTSDAIALASEFLLKRPKNIDTLTVPVQGAYQNGYVSYDGAVLEIDKEKNQQAINNFLNDNSSTVNSSNP
ncbi:transcriptional regulator [Heyndrickxia shackletonii]|uniref:Regulatory protein MsrR n=1 Tax=Heyndrickxia shackletonii TaxID=157838 RepID=A0A0Q3WVB2_9BACI|nr:LCP family protein [Heyndrickxia shackletonii]KQL52435.1 transcriptional regulator [Heyndrickxia shackletonii]MBB2479215.1 LCP family protein [Bacillus sp. APMAM]NEY99001.1 LCP family protein [Heyndrickxia shackletonii]RTZ57114.1 LytR family transcriptional regulator [Bacillus sp. SAJ1]